MFNKEKREQKRAKKLAKLEAEIVEIEARQVELEAQQAEHIANMSTYGKQWMEAERLFKEFKVSTFGNKKTLEGMINQANDSEVLKCVYPGNITIDDREIGEQIFFPGSWFVSNERIYIYHPIPFEEAYQYVYPLESLQSVSANGDGLNGKVMLTTDTAVITFAVLNQERTYRKIERVFNEIINAALASRQNENSEESRQLGIAVCSGCAASQILAKGSVVNCDYCRQPLSLETLSENNGNAMPNFDDQTASSPISVADEILKLNSLHNAGILTQEEFDHKKKMLLGM